MHCIAEFFIYANTFILAKLFTFLSFVQLVVQLSNYSIDFKIVWGLTPPLHPRASCVRHWISEHPVFVSIPVQHFSESSKFVYLNQACGEENRKCHRYARCVVKSRVEYCNCNIGFQGDGYSCQGKLITVDDV